MLPCLVSVCLCLLFVSCWFFVGLAVPRFLHGICLGPLQASSSLNHRRLDDHQSLGARTAAAQKKNVARKTQKTGCFTVSFSIQGFRLVGPS